MRKDEAPFETLRRQVLVASKLRDSFALPARIRFLLDQKKPHQGGVRNSMDGRRFI